MHVAGDTLAGDNKFVCGRLVHVSRILVSSNAFEHVCRRIVYRLAHDRRNTVLRILRIMALLAVVGQAQALEGREAAAQATHRALEQLGRNPVSLGIIVALLLAVLGVVIAFYLTFELRQ